MIKLIVTAYAVIVLERAAAAKSIFLDQLAQLRLADSILLVETVLTLAEASSTRRVLETVAWLVIRVAGFADYKTRNCVFIAQLEIIPTTHIECFLHRDWRTL